MRGRAAPAHDRPMTEHRDDQHTPAAKASWVRGAAALTVAAALGVGAVNLGISTSPGRPDGAGSTNGGRTELAGRYLNHNEILVRPRRRR